MSDSGFPPGGPGNNGSGGPRDLTNIPGLERGNEQNDGQRVRLIGVPNELNDVKKPVRLQAEIVGDNRDGSVRVRTEHGEFNIRPEHGRVQRPEVGQRVDIEIQPGNPPQQAVIREPTPVDQRHAPPPETQTATQEGARTAETPVNVELRSSTPTPTTRQAEPVQPQDVVRLLPLAANLAQDIVQPITELIQSSIVARTEIAAQIVVTETQAQEITNLIRALVQAPAQAPAVPQQTPILSLVQTEPVLPAPLLPILQPVLQDLPALNTPQIIPEVSFAPPQQSVLTPQTLTLLTPLVLAPTLTQPIVLSAAQGQTPPALSIEQQPFEARITAITQPDVQIVPPGQQTQNITAPNAAPIVQNTPVSNTAHVVGFIQQNLPVISFALPGDTSAPLFVIQIPGSTLPIGTQIQLTPQTPLPVITSTSLPPLTAAIPAAFLTPESTWPVLEQIYQSLTQVSPQAAQVLSNMTPQASNPAQLGPAALFFLAAVRSGDISSWLGDKTIDILRRDGKGNLLSRLTQEGSILSRLSAEPISQDWRGMSIPHFWEGEMHKMALYYKQDGGGDSDEQEKTRQTRFIFDLNLSQMGKVQLDGLFRTTRLDLIVRAETPFSQAMQREMKRTYSGALGQTQLAGELSFQNRPEQWVQVIPTEQTLGVSA
ncbi:MAG: hypothetical protein DHS20C02_01120 [Micavibrio sp.]|nr:MAG: hypothetical protein DHS20C02_01120 [Micavibrio sp.]